MRTHPAFLLSLLLAAACGGQEQAEHEAARERVAKGAEPAPQDHRVECSIGGEPLARVCLLERSAGGDGPVLTIRHPDGGFRRLTIAADGSLAAADGAEPAMIAPAAGDMIEVAIAGDRYRLPAGVAGVPAGR